MKILVKNINCYIIVGISVYTNRFCFPREVSTSRPSSLQPIRLFTSPFLLSLCHHNPSLLSLISELFTSSPLSPMIQKLPPFPFFSTLYFSLSITPTFSPPFCPYIKQRYNIFHLY